MLKLSLLFRKSVYPFSYVYDDHKLKDRNISLWFAGRCKHWPQWTLLPNAQ